MSSTLNTNILGEYVGPEWGVGRVIRWQPAAPAHKLVDIDKEVDVRRQVGLYKVQGEAVEAILGGIYFQFVSNVSVPYVIQVMLSILYPFRGVW